MSRVVKNNLPFLHFLTCCPEHQRQFLFETATPEQIHALVQILFNLCHGNIPVSKEVKRRGYESNESMSHESSYESGQRFCLESFQDGGDAWI